MQNTLHNDTGIYLIGLTLSLLALLAYQEPRVKRFPLFAALPTVLIPLCLILASCGSNSEALEKMPPGITHSPELGNYFQTQFDQTKACTGLSAGSFEELSISMEPPMFDCNAGTANGSCGGSFTEPNLIKVGVIYVYQHEVVHYLLYKNTGDADHDHHNNFFKKCI